MEILLWYLQYFYIYLPIAYNNDMILLLIWFDLHLFRHMLCRYPIPATQIALFIAAQYPRTRQHHNLFYPCTFSPIFLYLPEFPIVWTTSRVYRIYFPNHWSLTWNFIFYLIHKLHVSLLYTTLYVHHWWIQIQITLNNVLVYWTWNTSQFSRSWSVLHLHYTHLSLLCASRTLTDLFKKKCSWQKLLVHCVPTALQASCLFKR